MIFRKISTDMPTSFNLLITEDPEVGGYTMECPQMPGCITEAETLEELYGNWAEASKLWLQAAREDIAAGRNPFCPKVDSVRERVIA